MRKSKRLTARFVEHVREPGRYGDGWGGFGLSLLVAQQKDGGWSKTWSQRVILNGKPTQRGLGGSYPAITLTKAREEAARNALEIKAGRNPFRTKSEAPTFEDATEKCIAVHRSNWKKGTSTEQQWRNLFRDYVFPAFGHRPVDSINPSDVANLLVRLMQQKPATGQRVRQHISSVMSWACVHGYRIDNPAGPILNGALPKTNGTTKHHRALPHAQVADAVQRIREAGGRPASKLGLEFLILTGSRSGEVRGATWAEIDLDAQVWTVPAARMKANREHRVPLSQQALDVLAKAKALTTRSGLVFAGMQGKPLADSTFGHVLKGAGLLCTAHGFRSTFRDWCGDTGQSRELAELSLSHSFGNAVEQAYSRSDLLERRRALMQDWAKHCVRSS